MKTINILDMIEVIKWMRMIVAAILLPSLNRGIWMQLEEYTWMLAKEYDSVLGSIFMDGLPGGTYTRNWDASSFSIGIDFYRLRVGDVLKTQKLFLIK